MISPIQICSECAAELPVNAPEGLCPRCLAGMGLDVVLTSQTCFSPELEEHRTGPLALPSEVPAKTNRYEESSANRRENQAPRGAQTKRSGLEIHNTRLRHFGDYELLEEIDRGGMGVIYRARQLSLNRIVAVKMLLFGKFSSDEYIKRFRAEAEAAAGLQHPNIVAIHEIGEHEGQHYFSMDYVEGADLAEVAREGFLPAERAARYLKVIAEAIHYAHQRGVLHRDLKPSNVLIDELDQPRITDFGLAKQLKGDSELTATGHVLGSPSFMPPEQADARRGSIGPHSDVYSLGALFYHLLTGRPPFVAATIEEALRQLLEQDPVPPRLLNGSVPRDLETICLKCLNKEPARRYPSALALAQDLERWLRGEAILARPAGVLGKIWRWSRRQPALAGLTVAVGSLAVMVVIGSMAMVARERRMLSNEANLRQQAQVAEGKAISAARKSEKVVDMLEHILDAVGPSASAATKQEILDHWAVEVQKEYARQPETELDLSMALARAYHQSGLYQRMEEISRFGLELSEKCHESPHAAIAAALAMLADALMHLERLPEAEIYSRQALEMNGQLVGREAPELVPALNTLGVVLQRAHKLDAAGEIFNRALVLEIKSKKPSAQGISNLKENVAHVLREKGQCVEAEALYREVLALRQETLGPDNEDVATSIHNIARVLYDEQRYGEAEAWYGEALSRRRKLRGDEHPSVATTLHCLGMVLEAEGRWAEAEPLFREAIDTRIRLLDYGHPKVKESFEHLVSVLVRQGKTVEAQALMQVLEPGPSK